MRAAVLALALALSATALPAVVHAQGGVELSLAAGPPLGCEVADPRAAVHLADLARGTSRLDPVTTDGFAASLSTGSRPARIRLDGVPVPRVSVLHDAPLAWLPVALSEGVGAVVCDGPLGETTLDLRTHVRQGVAGAVQAGNETGDPGPLRYLDPSLPNVDKIGPDYEAVVVRGTPRSLDEPPGPVSRAALRWRDYLPTDPAIAPRTFGAVQGRFPKRKGLVGAAAVRSEWGRVRLGGVVAEDLAHAPSLGREVPVLRRAAHLFARSEGEGSEGPLRTLAVAHEQLRRPSWSRLDAGGRWTETVAHGAATLLDGRQRVGRRQIRLALHTEGEARHASGPGLGSATVGWGALGAAVRHLPVGRLPMGPLSGEARASVAAGVSGVALAVAARVETRATGRRVRAEAWAARRLPEMDPDLAFWAARGYTGLADPAAPLAAVAVRLRDEAALRLSAERPLAGYRATVRASVTLARRAGETVVRPRFESADGIPAGPVRLDPAGAGTVVQGRASIAWKALAAYAAGQAWWSGDAAFSEAREREPRLRGGLCLGLTDGPLALSARLEGRSATRWTGWPEPAVPAHAALDLSASRSFWLDRVRLSLSARNVLGAREQTHPLGATLDRRLFVRLEGRF